MSAIIPQPRTPITIRPATIQDLPFIDRLQKQHQRMVGFLREEALAGKIKLGQAIVAWASRPCSSEDMAETAMLREAPVGYCIASDRYMKREDVGIIYQMNVEPHAQRGFVGAALLKAQFERSAYGCRLYCCWCAQDIEANRFWEAMGFVPLAFRAGSEKRRRVHIFWEKRIREGDTETPWWFPSQTQGGCMEDRLVLPIPPAAHWSDAMPLLLPTAGVLPRAKQIEDKTKQGRGAHATVQRAPMRQPLSGGLQFSPPAAAASAPTADKPREKRARAKNDPKLIAAARELRDRWLERVNSPGGEGLLPGQGKYDISRERLLASVPKPSKLLVEAA